MSEYRLHKRCVICDTERYIGQFFASSETYRRVAELNNGTVFVYGVCDKTTCLRAYHKDDSIERRIVDLNEDKLKVVKE